MSWTNRWPSYVYNSDEVQWIKVLSELKPYTKKPQDALTTLPNSQLLQWRIQVERTQYNGTDVTAVAAPTHWCPFHETWMVTWWAVHTSSHWPARWCSIWPLVLHHLSPSLLFLCSLSPLVLPMLTSFLSPSPILGPALFHAACTALPCYLHHLLAHLFPAFLPHGGLYTQKSRPPSAVLTIISLASRTASGISYKCSHTAILTSQYLSDTSFSKE